MPNCCSCCRVKAVLLATQALAFEPLPDASAFFRQGVVENDLAGLPGQVSRASALGFPGRACGALAGALCLGSLCTSIGIGSQE